MGRGVAGRGDGADHSLSYCITCVTRLTSHPLDYQADNALDDCPPLSYFVLCFVLYCVLSNTWYFSVFCNILSPAPFRVFSYLVEPLETFLVSVFFFFMYLLMLEL